MSKRELSRLDPIEDPRWQLYLERHPSASVFHTPAWLDALRRTFSYDLFAITTANPGDELGNGIVFSRISSPLTGCRLVSLPFSDHCEPLSDSNADIGDMLARVSETFSHAGLKYIEIRPQYSDSFGHQCFAPASEYWLHTLDLRPSLDTLFRRTHKDCIQRKIRRAEREGLTIESGRSPALLNKFYPLLVQTRRRFGVPPHPFRWFQNLIHNLGETLELSVASKDTTPVAAILTLRYKDVIVYKYGCSDKRYSPMGAMPFLFWRMITDGKALGMRAVDFGRSDMDDTGLAVFKDRLGCERSRLKYWRSPAASVAAPTRSWARKTAMQVVRAMPAPVLTAVGSLVTRHLG